MLKRNLAAIIMPVIVISIMVGCATVTPPKPLAKTFFEDDYEMTVEIMACPEKPKLLSDAAAGAGYSALVGLVVNSGRSKNMQDLMEGIEGSTVQELIRQTITTRLEDYFDVVDEDASLATEITITNWGWYLPTGGLGVKKGSYQCRITGIANVYDVSKEEKENVGYAAAFAADAPLGNNPTKEQTQEALMKAIDTFAEQVLETILQNKI